jgi:MFS family permease
LFERDRIVAGTGFNRWLVPPAALAIHLCIGMAYGFTVFWNPLSRAIGITKRAVCVDKTLFDALFSTTCDWNISELGWMYTLFFVFLGSSAAIWGGWLERVGPRKAGAVAALCWCGGLLIGALGIMTHQLWLLLVGPGIIGGVGLGIGYISPVSTLIKWFPDRRGMATGMAIMGFGGGAMIGAPLATMLMGAFKSSDQVGVWQTFMALAAIYFVFMIGGAFGYRLPPAGWRPEGWTAPEPTAKRMITTGQVHVKDVHKTPQFWLVWAELCLNVSAGIGVLFIASPMLTEIFGGKLLGHPELNFAQLDEGQKSAIAVIAAGFAGLLSLFNIGGRFFWASLSDRIGRQATYFTFFGLGILMYALTPWAAHLGSKALFIGAFCIILSMYGGGFATIPAYLADLFGTQFVGAIHGRLLTAWSTAGVIGTNVVSYIREAELKSGMPGDQVYDRIMYILAGMLVLGLVANLLVRPVSSRWFMREDEVAALQAKARAALSGPGRSFGIGRGGLDAKAALAWAAVGIPLAWGVWITLSKSIVLFQ